MSKCVRECCGLANWPGRNRQTNVAAGQVGFALEHATVAVMVHTRRHESRGAWGSMLKPGELPPGIARIQAIARKNHETFGGWSFTLHARPTRVRGFGELWKSFGWPARRTRHRLGLTGLAVLWCEGCGRQAPAVVHDRRSMRGSSQWCVVAAKKGVFATDRVGNIVAAELRYIDSLMSSNPIG